MIHLIIDKDQKETICREVLTALPEWFEIPESIEEYALSVRDMPMWVDTENGQQRGFAALKHTSRYAAEIYVMGVCKQLHRNGIGRGLFNAMYQYALENGYEYLHVKTVAAGYYREYDLTNSFYRSLGFREMECIKELWGEDNPCQLYVMAIKR